MSHTPPQHLDAERSLLGGILMDPQALDDITASMEPGDLYSEKHRKVFEAMLAMSAKSEPIDRVTIKQELVSKGVFSAVGGDDFIDMLDKVVPSASNLTYYAKIIAEKAVLRRLIEASTMIAIAAYEQHGDTAEFLSEAERKILAVRKDRGGGGFKSMREITKEAFKRLQVLHDGGSKITGAPTGLSDLDELTGGMHAGQLIVLAARPAMGKTGLALQIAESVARTGKTAALFSLEMTVDEIGPRALANAARVDGQRLRSGQLLDSDWAKLAHAAGPLSELPLVVDDTLYTSAQEIRAKSRRLAQKVRDSGAPLGLIVIDYLQLAGEHGEHREQEIAAISRSLKALAKELSIPVLALSQLNRSLEKRTDKRPLMSDLRDSGAIEQDADAIWFIYRDEVYDPKSEDKGIAEIIIGKQRNGPTGIVRVAFLAEFIRFEDLSHHHNPNHFADPEAA